MALKSLLQCIVLSPSHSAAIAAAGRALQALGRPGEAARMYRRALTIAPDDAATWSDLGTALHALGQFDEAIGAYDQALRLSPDSPEVHYNRGCLHLVRLDYVQAMESFQTTLTLSPSHHAALDNLSIAQQAVAQVTGALSTLDRLLDLDPGRSAARLRRGKLLHAAGRHPDALADFTVVLGERPDHVQALVSRGEALRLLDAPEAALRDFDRALSLDPNQVLALVNGGNVLLEQQNYEAALRRYDEALQQCPDEVAALINRGTALHMLRRPAEAITSYRRALDLQPDNPQVLLDIGYCQLRNGAWREGWLSHEARLRIAPWADAAPTFSAPLWDGQTGVAGKRILLVGEAGLGDSIQFSRFAQLLTARDAIVILGVEPQLQRLMRTLPGVSRVVTPNDDPPEYDLYCPLMSLPARLGMGIPKAIEVPYLRPDPGEAATWRSRLGALPGFKVGLAWAGAPRAHDRQARLIDSRRSIRVSALAPLLSVPGVTFVSLQKGEVAVQASGLPVVDWTDSLGDFAGTATLISALDLVITVDTSVAHVAGALGQQVWVLNRFDRCWRWMWDRTDTPWYPTMRLFTQTTPGIWDGVVANVTAQLRSITASRSA